MLDGNKRRLFKKRLAETWRIAAWFKWLIEERLLTFIDELSEEWAKKYLEKADSEFAVREVLNYNPTLMNLKNSMSF